MNLLFLTMNYGSIAGEVAFSFIIFLLIFFIVFVLCVANSSLNDDIYELDEGATQEEIDLLSKLNSLKGQLSTLLEMSWEEYLLEKKGPVKDFADISFQEREELNKEIENKVKTLQAEISSVDKEFVALRKSNFHKNKLAEAEEMEKKASELIANNPDDPATKVEVRKLRDEAKRIKRVYS